MWYTLKDAADRGRLAASTFRQLNLAMAVVAVLQLAAYGYMSLAGESAAAGAHGWSSSDVVDSAVLELPAQV